MRSITEFYLEVIFLSERGYIIIAIIILTIMAVVPYLKVQGMAASRQINRSHGSKSIASPISVSGNQLPPSVNIAARLTWE